jgi:hypothetical protein
MLAGRGIHHIKHVQKSIFNIIFNFNILFQPLDWEISNSGCGDSSFRIKRRVLIFLQAFLLPLQLCVGRTWGTQYWPWRHVMKCSNFLWNYITILISAYFFYFPVTVSSMEKLMMGGCLQRTAYFFALIGVCLWFFPVVSVLTSTWLVEQVICWGMFLSQDMLAYFWIRRTQMAWVT